VNTRWTAAAAAAAMAVGLTACGSDDGGGDAGGSGGGGGKKVERIAFFGFAGANAFAQATLSGIKEQAKKEGVEVEFFDPKFDSATQVSQIQNAVTTGKFQAFIVQANDGNAVVPPIREAIDADIPVVGEFTPVGTKYDTLEPQVKGMYVVAEPPTENGTALGELGVKACGDRKPCRVAYLEGLKALPLDNARTTAAKAALAKSPAVQVVASVEGGYTQATGLKAAQNVLQAHPDVDVMIGSSQAIAGAEQAVKDAKAKVQLVGNGGSRQAVQAVKDGRWFATYVIAEKSAGAKAAEIAIAAARGEKPATPFDTRQLQDPLGTKDVLANYTGQYDE
jgi:ribose transport system substrate-binding protein